MEVKCRKDFCNIINELGFKTGVELGVAKGTYSLMLLENSNLEILFSIDRWSDHHNEAEFKVTKEKLKVHGKRSRIIRKVFSETLSKFRDGFFDFIYIDGYANTGQLDGSTLEDWYPKLRVGGMFSGHDYDDKWMPTKIAVNNFTAKYNKDFNITSEDKYNSWWFLK